MFEYHAWVTISEGTKEEDDNTALLTANIDSIKLAIKEYEHLGDIALFYANGSTYVRMDGGHNHYQSYVLSLFTEIGQIAVGSYGLLYIRDDESLVYANEFQVWRMTKGVVEKMKDPFLSPCQPTLEE